MSLGYWARPVDPNAVTQAAAKPKPSIAERLALQVVVDDTPAPVGRPLEVLPADLAAPDGLAPPPPVEPMVPRRPASGLVKVDAPVAAAPIRAAPALAPAIHEAPIPRAEPAIQTKPVVRPKPVIAKVAKPKPEPVVGKAAKPDPQLARLAKAKADDARAAKARKAAELAKLEKAKAEKAVRLAKAERAEKAKAAKLAAAKARPQKKTVLAKAEPPKKVAKVQVKAKPPAKSKKILAILRSKPEARQPVRPKTVKVAARPAPKKVAPAPRKPPVKTLIIPRGEGPMRVARADRCASPDPGEAVVCADQRLSARDRQLQAAYRNAEAAGVPAQALRNQQARWLAARAAAAREAPWAVEDVYVARISELRDQTRDAREE